MIMLISQVRKLRHRASEQLAHSHTVLWESTGVKSKVPREVGPGDQAHIPSP